MSLRSVHLEEHVLPQNATFLCDGEHHVVGDWYVVNLGTILCSMVVVISFIVFWYKARNAGPSVWRTPWMFVFYGYVLMQMAAIVMFGYFMHYAIEYPDSTYAKIAYMLGGLDLWGGYWCVGQFLIIGPLVDMGCLKWEGWLRAISYLVIVVVLIVLEYLELFGKPAGYHNPIVQKIVDASHTMVLVGNLMTVIEVIYMKWFCSKQALCIWVTTALNCFALYLRFTAHMDRDRMECIWYLFEGISLILLWQFYIWTRDLVDPVRRFSSQDEYDFRVYAKNNPHLLQAV